MAKTIEITDLATGAIQKLQQKVSSPETNAAIGAGAVALFQRHFLDLPPNQQGFPSSGLYAKFARSTNFRLETGGVMISVNHVAARQRYFGGLIKPTGGRQFLTIAALPQTYGKRAGDFNSLRFGFAYDAKRGVMRPALVEGRASEVSFGSRRKDGSRKVNPTASRTGLVPFFWLIRQADQKGDRGIIPSEADIKATALQAAREEILGGLS